MLVGLQLYINVTLLSTTLLHYINGFILKLSCIQCMLCHRALEAFKEETCMQLLLDLSEITCRFYFTSAFYLSAGNYFINKLIKWFD